MSFDNLINPDLINNISKDFALHRCTPLVGYKRLDPTELAYRYWRRWLSV